MEIIINTNAEMLRGYEIDREVFASNLEDELYEAGLGVIRTVYESSFAAWNGGYCSRLQSLGDLVAIRTADGKHLRDKNFTRLLGCLDRAIAASPLTADVE